MIVYRIENSINGKSYIGQSCRSASARFREHVGAAKNGRGCRLLTSAIAKYGEAAFSLEILAESDSPEYISNLERLWIITLATKNSRNGYNLADGGIASGTRGFRWRDASKAQLSATMLGNKRCLGVKRSEESKHKTRMSLLGHQVSEETRAKIRAARALQASPRGWTHTEAAKLKMSTVRKGQRVSPGTEFKPGFTPWNKGLAKQ